jgi:hypothetical protein
MQHTQHTAASTQPPAHRHPPPLSTDPAPLLPAPQIQMIGDDQRGWAWTRALLGLPASEVHVCGDLSAIELVRQLAQRCGDEFEVLNYERWAPVGWWVGLGVMCCAVAAEAGWMWWCAAACCMGAMVIGPW